MKEKEYIKAVRMSNFELLRIISIIGIITMHSYGNIGNSATGLNFGVGFIFNAAFNACVSCFILISGYFGIKYNLKKLLTLHLQILFITISALAIGYFFTGNISKVELVKSCIPIISRKYWFISCYFALTFLAPFINQIPEKLSRKSLESLLLVLILIFYVVPSFFFFELTMDGGKGIINMIIVYLIGRYIKLYITKSYPKKSLIILILIIIGIISLLNYIITILHGGVGIYAPFSRDSSIFILVLAILTLLFFRDIQFKSKIINYISSSVLIIYIAEGYVRVLLNHYFEVINFVNSWYFTIVLFLYVISVFLISFFIEIFRRYTIGRFDSFVVDYEITRLNALLNFLNKKIVLTKYIQSTLGREDYSKIE